MWRGVAERGALGALAGDDRDLSLLDDVADCIGTERVVQRRADEALRKEREEHLRALRAVDRVGSHTRLALRP